MIDASLFQVMTKLTTYSGAMQVNADLFTPLVHRMRSCISHTYVHLRNEQLLQQYVRDKIIRLCTDILNIINAGSIRPSLRFLNWEPLLRSRTSLGSSLTGRAVLCSGLGLPKHVNATILQTTPSYYRR